MGSFHSTCGVSGLPVADGDAVRWFFIGRRPDKFQTSLLDRMSRWDPLSLPLQGIADDGGTITDVVEDVLCNLQREWFTSAAQPISARRDYEWGRAYPKTLKSLIGACERDELLIKHMFGITRTAPFLVLEEIYQEVVALGLRHGGPTVFKPLGEEERRRRVKLFVDYHREFDAQFKAHMELTGDARQKSSDERYEREEEIRELFLEEEQRIAISLQLKHATLPSETWDALEEGFVQFGAFVAGMQRLRCDWRPSLWRDQNTEYEIHEQFHLKVAELARSKKLEE
jgi:hypothetical protein